jgi:hypothetical protein
VKVSQRSRQLAEVIDVRNHGGKMLTRWSESSAGKRRRAAGAHCKRWQLSWHRQDTSVVPGSPTAQQQSRGCSGKCEQLGRSGLSTSMSEIFPLGSRSYASRYCCI